MNIPAPTITCHRRMAAEYDNAEIVVVLGSAEVLRFDIVSTKPSIHAQEIGWDMAAQLLHLIGMSSRHAHLLLAQAAKDAS